MGTRNLTAVMIGGEYKIAQYGQWDGYPRGQGVTILKFLSEAGKIENLKAALPRCRFLDKEGRDKDFLEAYDKNAPEWSSDADKRTPEQKYWFESYISRDTGGDILGRVAYSRDAEILLKNSISFANDSLFCEWAYVIDFDKGTLEVYSGFNKKPVPEGERFAKGEKDGEYYPVKHRATFQLSALPSVKYFLTALKEEDKEDDN